MKDSKSLYYILIGYAPRQDQKKRKLKMLVYTLINSSKEASLKQIDIKISIFYPMKIYISNTVWLLLNAQVSFSFQNLSAVGVINFSHS